MLRIIKGNTGVQREQVDETVDKYINLHKDVDSAQRMEENSWLVKKYYDLATGLCLAVETALRHKCLNSLWRRSVV
jgi:hypothetical protein